RRPGPRPLDRRKWRSRARLRALALQRFEQRGLLAADVGTVAAVELDVQWVVHTHRFGSEVALRASLRDRLHQHPMRPVVLEQGLAKRGVAAGLRLVHLETVQVLRAEPARQQMIPRHAERTAELSQSSWSWERVSWVVPCPAAPLLGSGSVRPLPRRITAPAVRPPAK